MEDILKIISSDRKLIGIPNMLYDKVEISRLKSTKTSECNWNTCSVPWVKNVITEHRRKLEKQHFCERWPGGFSWLPLQNIKLDGLSWPINFHILLKGHEGPAAVVCKLHLRRCSDSLGGVQPEAWGGLACKTCSSWSGLSWGEAGLSWGFSGQHSFCGQRSLWTDGTQVHASLMARLVSLPWVENRFGALWGSFQILDSAVLDNLHFALISEPLTYGLEMGWSL